MFTCTNCNEDFDMVAHAIDEDGMEYCEECSHDLVKCDGCKQYWTPKLNHWGIQECRSDFVEHRMKSYCLECASKLVSVPDTRPWHINAPSHVKDMVVNMVSNHYWKEGKFYLWGDDACFHKLNSQYGYKIFRDRDERDCNYENQASAARYGLAPPIGCKFAAIDIHGWHCYGYLTGIAEMKNYYDGDDFIKLVCLLKVLGLSDQDMHDGNIGIYDGRLVKIDFSK